MSETGKKYVPNGVFLKCDKGATPCQLTVLPTLVTLYGEPWATEMDALPMVNVMPFGVCTITTQPCVPATMMWQKAFEGGLKVNGFKPILENSFLPCTIGGKIEIFFTQQAAMASVAADDAHAKADTAKEISLGFLVGAALVGIVAVGLTVATGGAAAPLLLAAGQAVLTGAAIGAGVGAVAGGIQGYATEGSEGIVDGAVSGGLMGAVCGAMGGIASVGGAIASGLLGLSAATFGIGAALDTYAFVKEPNLKNGLVVVGDLVILAGGKLGERFVKSQFENNRIIDKTSAKAKELIESQSKSERGPCLSSIYDPVTGKTFYGQNFKNNATGKAAYEEWILKEPQNGGADPIVKDIVNEYDAKIKTGEIKPSEKADTRYGAHSEVRAYSDALKARREAGLPVDRSTINELKLHNRDLWRMDDNGVPLTKIRCENCSYITNGIEVIGHK